MRFTIPVLTDPNFVWSTASEFLAGLEMGLGAGYLLINEYWNEARGTDKDGFRRVSDSMKILEDIRDGNIALFWADGNLLPAVASQNKSGGKIRGLPDTTTTDEYERRFSVNDKF